MEPFAEAADFIALHPELDEFTDAQIDAQLAYVSAAISQLCDADEIDDEILKSVACDAAARRLNSKAGVQSESWGASPYSGSTTYANPTGDLYLTAFEKKLLGIDGDDLEAVFVMPGEAAEDA